MKYLKYYFEVFKSWNFDKKSVFILGVLCALSFAIVNVVGLLTI